MSTPETSDNFLPLRNGLVDHVEDGRLSLKLYALFSFILQLISREERFRKTGTLLTNARILSEKTRESVESIRWALSELRARRYVYYEDARGNRGLHRLFVDKYRVRVAPGSYYFTSIFRDSTFVGESVFFARLKVCWLWHKIGPGSRLCFKSSRLSTDFTTDFPADFQELIQTLDIYTQNQVVCECLAEFKADFKTDFQQSFFKIADTEIYIQKKQQRGPFGPASLGHGLSEAEELQFVHAKEKLSALFPAKNMTALVRIVALSQMPHAAKIDVLYRMIDRDTTDPIFNPWGFVRRILEDEFTHLQQAQDLLRHEEWKRFDPSLLGPLRVTG